MKKTSPILSMLIALFCAASVSAQNPQEAKQAELQGAFRGTVVVLKLDMPAIRKGVDIYADTQNSFDPGKNQNRLKTYGTAIASGQSARVTGIRVSKDEISFELDGGGAPMNSSAGRPGSLFDKQSMSPQEVSRRNQVSAAPGNGSNDNIRRDIRFDTFKREGEEHAGNVDKAARSKEELEAARRDQTKMGSRFIIKFNDIDPSSITPEQLRHMLADYVAF